MINMKKTIIIFTLLITLGLMSFGQETDPLVGNCVSSAGPDTKYLKDFRIQLGQTAPQSELRFKANMSLWKNTKYRFTMCNADNSKGQLILAIKDEENKPVLSSLDKKTGKIYSSVDFECQKSGIYQINFDFSEGQQGSAVGVVSMIK
jgi:hypothetical protein